MKKLILIMLGILIIPMVMAINEDGNIISGGNLLITDVDVKVDFNSDKNLDYGDEINKEAHPDSIVKFLIKLKNNYSISEMKDVELTVTLQDIDDGDDLDEEIEEYDLDENEDKRFTLTFTIPSNVEEDTYSVLISSEGIQNATIHEVEYTLDLVVEFDEEQSSPDSLSQRIDSLNSTVGKINENIGSYFEPYAKCVSERKAFEKTVETRDTTIISIRGYESKFTTCNTNLLVCNTERAVISAANVSCNYMIQNEYIPEIKSKENWVFLGVIGTAGGFLVYIQMKKKKEKEGTEGEEPPPDEDEAT